MAGTRILFGFVEGCGRGVGFETGVVRAASCEIDGLKGAVLEPFRTVPGVTSRREEVFGVCFIVRGFIEE